MLTQGAETISGDAYLPTTYDRRPERRARPQLRSRVELLQLRRRDARRVERRQRLRSTIPDSATGAPRDAVLGTERWVGRREGSRRHQLAVQPVQGCAEDAVRTRRTTAGRLPAATVRAIEPQAGRVRRSTERAGRRRTAQASRGAARLAPRVVSVGTGPPLPVATAAHHQSDLHEPSTALELGYRATSWVPTPERWATLRER